ncbi:MAG: hypothetical protein EOO07_15640 [Chitinophagaceae bacterium]|nr:MAG: hypothetical protein EOO07_15640 [Chitinophagaceae bacterium]
MPHNDDKTLIMYKLPYFTADNQEEILEFMHQNTFVTLVGFDGEFPVATQVPVKTVIDDEVIKLIGHIMTKPIIAKLLSKTRMYWQFLPVLTLTSAHRYMKTLNQHLPGIIKPFRLREE